MPAMLVGRPVLESLAADPVLRRTRRAALERVAAGMRSRRFRRGEVIFHLGDPGDALFIIVVGRGEDLAAVRDRRRGDPRDAPARATSSASWPCSTARRARPARRPSAPTETVVLPRDRFRELIATEAGVRDALLASIAGELRRLTTHVEELHFLDITGRLAARLVRLAQEGGTPPTDGAHPARGPT